MRVLICETDRALARAIEKALASEPFVSDLVERIEDCVDFAVEVPYDAIILDLGSPANIVYLRRLREKKVKTPVLANGCTRAEDRIRALEAGADQCLTTPLSLHELIASLKALLRRPAQTKEQLIRVGDLELDLNSRIVRRRGRTIALTMKEFELLSYLMMNSGQPMTRTRVIEHVWNSRFDGLTNVVDVYINRLRAKIDRGFEKQLIHTRHGFGYVVSATESAEEHLEENNESVA